MTRFTSRFKLNVVEVANDPTRRQPALQPATIPGFEAITVAEYLNRWLAHAQTRVRPGTYEGYESLIRCHISPVIGHQRLADLHPLHLQDLYTARLTATPTRRALSPSSVLNLHLVLTQALQQAVRWQLLTVNPAHGAQPPRPQRPEPIIATGETLQRVLKHLRGHPLELPATIALTTGMRRGEVCGLRWSDLSDDYTSAHIRQTLQATRTGFHFQQPKTHRSRRPIALPASLRTLLTEHRTKQESRRAALADRWQHTDLIVDRGDGGPLHPDTLSSAWRRFIRDHRLPHIRLHDLRHSHASLLLLEGVHPKIVSERLGHASVSFTLQAYTHLLPDMQNEAADAMDRVLRNAAA
jgi:integrase